MTRGNLDVDATETQGEIVSDQSEMKYDPGRLVKVIDTRVRGLIKCRNTAPKVIRVTVILSSITKQNYAVYYKVIWQHCAPA